MSKHSFRRCWVGLLALVLVVSMMPVCAFAAEDGICVHHTAHDDSCGYAPAVEAADCTHDCQKNPDCLKGGSCSHLHQINCYNDIGKLDCDHACINSPDCTQPGCVHTHDDSCGYREAAEGKPCRFAEEGCPECRKPEFTLIPLISTHVTLDETEFTYTGQEIRPNVTVRVNGKLLTLDRDYRMEYVDNVEVGTAKVVVTGIGTASETVGYTGTVEHPFFIKAQEPEVTEPSKPTEPEVTEPSKPTEPEVTEPSKPTEPEVTEPSKPTEPEVTEPSKPTEPEVTEPSKPTEPEVTEPSKPTEPEVTEPAQPEKVTYKITKGDKTRWVKGSGKRVPFVTDGKMENLVSVSIDGKKVQAVYYLAEKDTVTLRNALLEKLSLGKHTITLEFANGEAAGTFTVLSAEDDNPKTGDTFPVHLMTGVLFTSLTALAGIGFVAFKKKMKK